MTTDERKTLLAELERRLQAIEANFKELAGSTNGH